MKKLLPAAMAATRFTVPMTVDHAGFEQVNIQAQDVPPFASNKFLTHARSTEPGSDLRRRLRAAARTTHGQVSQYRSLQVQE